MKTDLELAITNLRSAARRYEKPDRYYRGDHDLAFATEKFESAFGSLFREFALNLCPSICDAVRDKLKITGFSLGTQAPPSASRALEAKLSQANNEPRSTIDDPPYISSPHVSKGLSGSFDDESKIQNLKSQIDEIWSQNRMDLTAEEIHLEALKVGDSYAIVWPGPDGQVSIYPQRAAQCTVSYDEEIPGRMKWGAKYWRDASEHIRLEIFYPDRIEYYISRSKSSIALPDFREFQPLGTQASPPASVARDAASPISSVVVNPFGGIPLFHFANTSEIGSFGRSELAQAIPIQNGLNKSVLDMLVAMEFSSFRQRWVSGIEFDLTESGEATSPFRVGVDRLWMSSNPQATFGDFNTTDLEQFLKVKDSFRVDMAGVTGTPLHYFLQNVRGFASAEALKRAESRFIAKVRDRQKAFGQTWSALMSFALQVAGCGPGIRLRTQWEDPAPIAERELLENLVLKQRLGVSTRQLLLESGYGDQAVTEMLASPTPDSLGSEYSMGSQD